MTPFDEHPEPPPNAIDSVLNGRRDHDGTPADRLFHRAD
jgi:hypothetical protein